MSREAKLMNSFRIIALATLTLCASVSATSGETLWKALPDGTRIPVPPNEHPRLYLRADRLDDLRDRIDHPVLFQTWENLQVLGGKNAHYSMTVDAFRYLLEGDRQTRQSHVDARGRDPARLLQAGKPPAHARHALRGRPHYRHHGA